MPVTESIKGVLAVAAGGAFGAVCRYLISVVFGSRPTKFFVLSGTVVANVLGCFCIGLAVAALPKEAVTVRLLLITGVLGSLTTFSTYSYETVALVQRRAYVLAIANALGSVIAGLLAVGLGLWIGSRLRGT